MCSVSAIVASFARSFRNPARWLKTWWVSRGGKTLLTWRKVRRVVMALSVFPAFPERISMTGRHKTEGSSRMKSMRRSRATDATVKSLSSASFANGRKIATRGWTNTGLRFPACRPCEDELRRSSPESFLDDRDGEFPELVGLGLGL